MAKKVVSIALVVCMLLASLLVFGGTAAAGNGELYTAMVRDIYPGAVDSEPYALSDVNGTLFFAADYGSHGIELWKSDGTEEGTVMVKDIRPGAEGSIPYYLMAEVNGMLLFAANDGTNGPELWRSDGIEALLIRVLPGRLP